MKKILFLCTGNYYRSRFAEEYFNHFADRFRLNWQADSMGLQRDFKGNGNLGPMAQNTLNKLASLNIVPRAPARLPRHVYLEDLQAFDRVIAVSRDEHQPMVQALWPNEKLAIEYFDVEDLHIEGPETALPRLVWHMDALLAQICSEPKAV